MGKILPGKMDGPAGVCERDFFEFMNHKERSQNVYENTFTEAESETVSWQGTVEMLSLCISKAGNEKLRMIREHKNLQNWALK
nr:hypothetical protein BaRGS_002143 [Batillaria attramentaria]